MHGKDGDRSALSPDGARHAPVPQGRARRFLHLGRAVGEMAASAADVPVDPLTRPGVPQAQCDHIAAALSRLSINEFFRMRLVQTDSNFANFLLCTQLELNEVLGAELGTPPGPARQGAAAGSVGSSISCCGSQWQ